MKGQKRRSKDSKACVSTGKDEQGLTTYKARRRHVRMCKDRKVQARTQKDM